jgi:hypothetical protein
MSKIMKGPITSALANIVEIHQQTPLLASNCPMNHRTNSEPAQKRRFLSALACVAALTGSIFFACPVQAQSPALLFQFPFDEPRTGDSFGTTNTAGNVVLQMVNGAATPVPTDYHGLDNSGVATVGRALDFSSNTTQPTGGTGPLASDVNDANLGFGVISNFVITTWFKLDSFIVSPGNLSPQMFIFGPNGIVAGGDANSLSMKLNNPSQVQFQLNNGSATLNVNANSAGTYPTNLWLFFAAVYDGTNVVIYKGTEASPATVVITTPAAGLTFNIGSAGTLLVGNRATRVRALDGWLDDLRLYAGYGSASFVENIRREAAPTPIIGNFYPNGLLEPTNKFTFTATSAAGINTNSVQVTLIGSNESTNFTTNVTSQLTFSGPQTNVTVSFAGLTSNTIYTAMISVTDLLGISAATTANFDTYAPLFVWEAENWDFTNGMYIDSPVVSTNSASSYYAQTGTSGVDETVLNYSGANPHGWRPLDLQSTDVSGDVTRQPYITAGISDYQVGFFNSGNWLNYTRTFPSGTYYVYGRLAEGAGAAGTATLSLVTNGWGTGSQSVAQLGVFSFTGAGWSSYGYVPLTDNSGNPIAITLSGVNTLRLTSTTAGGVNVNFLMLVPAKTDLPKVTQVYPDGSTFFQTTNKLVFKVSGPYAINTNDVTVTLNGINLSSNLVFSGSSTSWDVSLSGLQSNIFYAALITVTDVNGGTFNYHVGFDTFNSANFSWEAEDFDFNNGQFIDNPVVSVNPQPDSYFQIGFISGTPAVTNVDVTTTDTAGGEHFDYRLAEPCGTAVNQDILRPQFVPAGASDYYVGWWNAGQWINYTRTFPTNTYYIYGRLAAASGAALRVTNSIVTSGWGTSSQTSDVLGMFSGTGSGFQGWQWLQLLGTNGQPAKVYLAGTNTFKMTAGGSINANFYLLVPAPAVANPVTIAASRNGADIVISFPTQTGFTYTVYYKTALTDLDWTLLTPVSGDGTTRNVMDTIGAGNRFYRVGIQ